MDALIKDINDGNSKSRTKIDLKSHADPHQHNSIQPSDDGYQFEHNMIANLQSSNAQKREEQFSSVVESESSAPIVSIVAKSTDKLQPS